MLADHVQRLHRSARDGNTRGAAAIGFRSAAGWPGRPTAAHWPSSSSTQSPAAGTPSTSGLPSVWRGQSSRSASPATSTCHRGRPMGRSSRSLRATAIRSVRTNPHPHGSSPETAARRGRYGPTATPASVARSTGHPSGDEIAFRTWTNRDNGESLGVAAGSVDAQLVPLLPSTSGGDALLGWAGEASVWVVPFGVTVPVIEPREASHLFEVPLDSRLNPVEHGFLPAGPGVTPRAWPSHRTAPRFSSRSSAREH